MEHRNGSRVPARLNIYVRSAERHLGWYRTRDLGRGGLSIDGRLPDLKPNSFVYTTLELGEGDAMRLIDLPALVVHLSDRRTGLMWASEASALESLEPLATQLAA